MIFESILDNTPHVSTENVDLETWRENRKKGIGGSDAGAVMGMNAFASPLTVYLQKKGLVPNIGNRAMERGTLLEPIIRKATQEEYPGLEIETVPYMFEHPQYPFMLANIDGAVLAENPVEVSGVTISGLGGYEVKSAKTAYGWSDTEIPDSYYCQVQHYMAVLGLPWFVVSVYILDNEEIRHYVIPRNDEFIKRLIEAEADFWNNYIVPGVMPAAIGIDNEDDMITGMFDGIPETILLGNTEKDLCAEYVNINTQIKDLETRKRQIQITMKEAIVQRGVGNPSDKKASAVAGPYSVSWSFYSRKSVDTDALKKAGLYETYAKTTETDRFTISEKKGAA